MTTSNTVTFTVSAASALQAALSSLSAGESALYSATNALTNVSQGSLDWQQHWHFANGYGHLLHKGANGANLRYYRYVESTDAWTELYNGQPAQNAGGYGHVWGGNPFDPATDRVWWHDDSTSLPKHMLRWNGSDWTTEFNTGNAVAEAMGSCWHPTLNGGSIIYWIDTTLYAWRSSNGAISELYSGAESESGYYAVGIYHPASDAVLMFAGTNAANSGGYPVYSVSNTGTVTSIARSPRRVTSLSSGYASGDGTVTLGYAGDVLILARPGSTSTVWKLNAARTAWDTMGWTHPFYSQFGSTWLVDPFPDGPLSVCNVYFNGGYYVWAVGNDYSTSQTTRTAVWRPDV